MTDVQLQYCKKCLNRKKGKITQENNCNLLGFDTIFEGVCTSFDLDKNVIIGIGTRIKDIKSNNKRAKLAQIFIWIIMALDIIKVYSSYLQYDLLKGLQSNEEVTETMINYNDLRVQLLAIIYPLVYITSAIFFINWFRRAYFNLSKIIKCDHSDDWAVWSWFIPIICIYRPYKIMKEMNDKITLFLKSREIKSLYDISKYIGIWWALWILSNYIGNYLLKVSFKEDSLNNLLNYSIGEMFLSLIGIPLAIITVKIIKSYSYKEDLVVEISKNTDN